MAMPLEDSQQACELREAALAFARGGVPGDDSLATVTNDLIDERLLDAALAYAAAVSNPDGGDGKEPL